MPFLGRILPVLPGLEAHRSRRVLRASLDLIMENMALHNDWELFLILHHVKSFEMKPSHIP
jgi:hypothetical protein